MDVYNWDAELPDGNSAVGVLFPGNNTTLVY